MIEEAILQSLFNYGAVGTMLVVMIYDKYKFQTKLTGALDNNTAVMIQVRDAMVGCPAKRKIEN